MADAQFRIPGRWSVHSYYSLCPYAPDGSDRILAAGCDLKTGMGEVYILDAGGQVLCSFGRQKVTTSFFHTGFWQSWGPDGTTVYYSASDGDSLHPKVGLYDLKTGQTRIIDGDMEGTPCFGEPIYCGLHSMLYAAGYGDGRFHPELAPVPFAARERHGLYRVAPSAGTNELALSVEKAIEYLPELDRFRAEDEKFASLGGLTMMAYCVRYSRDGKRLLFYLGNHCVDRRRGEPKLTTIFTAKSDLTDIHMAVDISYEKRGVHFAWQPDGEHLIGYGPKPGGKPGEIALVEVRYDGTGYRMISEHRSGGHPSVSPADSRLAVTDEKMGDHGCVVFLDTRDGSVIERVELPKFNHADGPIPPGRNRYFVCHHPVFNQDGTKVLCNQLDGEEASFYEIDVAEHIGGKLK